MGRSGVIRGETAVGPFARRGAATRGAMLHGGHVCHRYAFPAKGLVAVFALPCCRVFELTRSTPPSLPPPLCSPPHLPDVGVCPRTFSAPPAFHPFQVFLFSLSWLVLGAVWALTDYECAHTDEIMKEGQRFMVAYLCVQVANAFAFVYTQLFLRRYIRSHMQRDRPPSFCGLLCGLRCCDDGASDDVQCSVHQSDSQSGCRSWCRCVRKRIKSR